MMAASPNVIRSTATSELRKTAMQKHKLFRYDEIHYGPDHAAAAKRREEEITSSGFPVFVEHGNGCVMLSWMESESRGMPLFDYEGERLSLADIARRKGVNINTFYGWVSKYGFDNASKREFDPMAKKRAFLRMFFGEERENGAA